jgi:hydrogenase expression/formation protein HypC
MCLGIPGQVINMWEDAGIAMATVDFGGATKTVCLAYLPEVVRGEYVIVHAGFAITRLDEGSARRTLEMFRELGLLAEELAGSDEHDRVVGDP